MPTWVKTVISLACCQCSRSALLPDTHRRHSSLCSLMLSQDSSDTSEMMIWCCGMSDHWYELVSDVFWSVVLDDTVEVVMTLWYWSVSVNLNHLSFLKRGINSWNLFLPMPKTVLTTSFWRTCSCCMMPDCMIAAVQCSSLFCLGWDPQRELFCLCLQICPTSWACCLWCWGTSSWSSSHWPSTPCTSRPANQHP